MDTNEVITEKKNINDMLEDKTKRILKDTDQSREKLIAATKKLKSRKKESTGRKTDNIKKIKLHKAS